MALLALAAGAVAAPGRDEDPSAAVRALTGARTRVVWCQQMTTNGSDEDGLSSDLRLMGLDTDDGKGVREILPGPRGCRRPMLTPDGQRIVYTDFPHQTIGVVNWDGTGRRKVARGAASDVWRDPKTGGIWVIAITAAKSAASVEGCPVSRILLNHPRTVQTLWDRTTVSADTFQLSADGTRAIGLFPWPQVGFANLEKKTWEQYGKGCWPSLAPDDSYLGWYLDGPHRNVTFIREFSDQKWAVNISESPDVKGAEIYHPRWSNRRQFLCLSGPYARGLNAAGATNGYGEVEIHLGRFSPDLKQVEAWVRVTHNEFPDFFPDAWIEGGAQAAAKPPVAAAP